MPPLPPQLELPEGNRFTLPTVSAVRELVPAGGQLPAHMVLMMAVRSATKTFSGGSFSPRSRCS